MENQIHIMAIGAHAGDMELTCGGVLVKHALMGHRVTLVHMTPGEKGHPILSDREYREQKISEAEEFARIIGGEAIVLDHKDGELQDSDEVKFEVCDLIRKYKPDILITHWKNSMHKDHAATHRIAVDAFFYAAIKSFERELPVHSVRSIYFAENWEDPYDFQPYIYMDITEGYELWKKAVKCYEFVTKSPYFKYLEYYDALSVIRGAECRRPRAEAFAVDPLSIKQVLDSFVPKR